MDARHTNWQGMNWIRQEKRLAIYLRDGCACVWCGAAVEDGVQLTLDHVVPHVNGGTNDATNLVTACHRCNTSRGARSVLTFAKAVADYVDHGVSALAIQNHVLNCAHRPLDVKAAKDLIARRGSAAGVLASRVGA